MDFIQGSGLVRRFTALGLPTYLSVPLGAEIDKWVDNSGPAWTVKRLKSLKQDLIRDLAGHPTLTWVRKNRKGGWYGVLGSILNYSRKSEKCFARAVSALMVYSQYRPSEPTEEHIQKFYASVQARPGFLPVDLKRDIAKTARTLLGSLSLGDVQSLVTFEGASSTRSPIFGEGSVPQNAHLEKELRWIENPYNNLFLNRHWECYSHVLKGLDPYKVRGPLQGLSGGILDGEFGPFQTVHSYLKPPFMPVPAGKVVPLTKDGGWKVRWIASPYRIHQMALAPLGSAIYDELKTLPWDCTFQQEKALPIVQTHLSEGRTAYAVDLSSATDYFPLELQESVLRATIDSPYVDLFLELSRCSWESPMGTVQWTKGQPMGLYPSFCSFALTHGILLYMLAGQRVDQFYILGDDVIILDDRLYELYVKALDVLNCPHDPFKSIVSNRITEFAGKIITPNSVITPYKWRKVSDDSFMDMMRNYGQSFEPLLTNRQKNVYRKVAHLLPPWGCNHSQGDSLPLSMAVQLTDEFEDGLPLSSPRRLHTSFLGWITQVLEPWRPESLFHRLHYRTMKRDCSTFDEKVLAAFSRTPFHGWKSFPSVLSDILEVTGYTGLPAVGPKTWAGRETTLDTYERVLGFRKTSR